MSTDLVGIAKALKKPNVASLNLFQKYTDLQKRTTENRKLGFLGFRHSEPLFAFSRALAWALCGGGWLQELELGFSLWERDLKILAEAISQSTTLKRLSFANSELGDNNLQLLGKSLQECAQLEVLNLSACALTDAVAPLLSSILKANVCRKAQADWQASLRSSKGVNALTMRPKGLTALDVSFNNLSDASTQLICSVLRIGTPLEALSLRGNQLTRVSGKVLLEVMEEWAILRFVDLRDNTDNRLMGVLEDGQHLTTFSQMHPPFWTTLPSSSKSRKANSKRSAKSLMAANASRDVKPKDIQKRYLQPGKICSSTRPQSAPSILPNNFQRKGLHQKPALMLPLSARKCTDNGGKAISNFISFQQLKKNTKRPSTSTNRKNYNRGRHHISSSSSSTSPEIAAWEHDDSNSKENSLALQMSRVDTSLTFHSGIFEGNVHEEGNPWKGGIKTKLRDSNETACQPFCSPVLCTKNEKIPLTPLDLSRSQKFREDNNDVGKGHIPKFDSRERSGAGPRKSQRSKSQIENLEPSCERQNRVHQNTRQKKNFKQPTMGNHTPKFRSPSRNGIRTPEWNSFLKEITEALLHLQERLDKLIGPADPNSLTTQAASQLQVLCGG